MRVQAGTGMSRAQDATQAGVEAAREASASLKGMKPELVMVFTTPRYDLEALLAGIRSVTGDAILVGGTSSGEIVNGRYLGFGGGVGVLAMTAGPYRFGVASAELIRGNLDQAGQTIARESRSQAGASPHATIVLLADSLLGDLQQLVQGVYRVTGPKVALVGGGTGDEQKFIRSFVFHNNQVVREGALALWIAGASPLRVVTRHGWSPIGLPMIVTRAKGAEVIEIGGRPAALAYEEQLGLSPGELPPEKFWDTSIYHPLGLLQQDGTSVIRMARAKTDQGTLQIQGCVPPGGSAVQVMSGTADTLLSIVGEVARDALDVHPDPGVLLTFSCAARAAIMGKRTEEECQTLRKVARDVPTFGFYCCAEFARTAGVLGTHNATLTALAL